MNSNCISCSCPVDEIKMNRMEAAKDSTFSWFNFVRCTIKNMHGVESHGQNDSELTKSFLEFIPVNRCAFNLNRCMFETDFLRARRADGYQISLFVSCLSNFELCCISWVEVLSQIFDACFSEKSGTVARRPPRNQSSSPRNRNQQSRHRSGNLSFHLV